MDTTSWAMGLFGGMIIGTSATILWLFHGRIAGISGILSSTLFGSGEKSPWRLPFLGGLLAGGLLLRMFMPSSLVMDFDRSPIHLIIAGLLVGIGTLMGGGCTSGHGICGNSRLSPRSIVATLTFMIFGVVAATAMRWWIQGAS